MLRLPARTIPLEMMRNSRGWNSFGYAIQTGLELSIVRYQTSGRLKPPLVPSMAKCTMRCEVARSLTQPGRSERISLSHRQVCQGATALTSAVALICCAFLEVPRRGAPTAASFVPDGSLGGPPEARSTESKHAGRCLKPHLGHQEKDRLKDAEKRLQRRLRGEAQMSQ